MNFKLFVFILCLNGIKGFSNGKLPSSVCKDMKPGAPHGRNQVTDQDDLDPPFVIQADYDNRGFVIGT
jgi:hypothetical protein